LLVTQPLLPEPEVAFAREHVDGLFAHWRSLPRRLAPGPPEAAAPPLIARIHRITALDQAMVRCQLVETCRAIAVSILGVNKVWCRYNGAIYKQPGAGNINWHQDFTGSTTGTPKQSVHFWIPLNDHSGNAGSLVFVPGSHRRGLARHRIAARFGRRTARTEDALAGVRAVRVALSVGNFSIHTPWTTHRSDPNESEQTRKALVLEFSPGPWSAAREVGPSLASSFLSQSG
jgi:ectoine hydroxylase-related dioxygenase (phytanoyl-CoA dioxygenase family)